MSNICLGTGGLGSTIDGAASFALLDAFVEAGGTYLDTAHVYADWIPGERHRSERTIGRWLKATDQRDRMLLATKGAHPDLASMATPRLSPADIAHDLDESLACLGVERIDLYWLHRDDPLRPVGEIVEAMNDQVHAGKIRCFGCSNWQPERISAARDYAAAHGRHSFASSQIFWSLAVPNPGAFPDDHALMDEAADAYYATAGISVHAFTCQARGFFSKADSGGIDALKAALRRDFENEATLGRLARARELARSFGVSVAAIVLAYLTSQAIVGVPIIGPTTVEQLHDSLASPELLLEPEVLRYLSTGER